METKHDVQWQVYELIQNMGRKVLIGFSTCDVIITLDNGKEIKVKFEEVK
jgi:hypothetical protein